MLKLYVVKHKKMIIFSIKQIYLPIRLDETELQKI